jgi:hypothetical protein
MIRLAIIRGKDVADCPYGLSITKACHTVGTAIFQMRVLSEIEPADIEKSKSNNEIIYTTQQTGESCPFANEIMDKFDKVDCSFGDMAAGEKATYIPASPLYPRTFIGNGVNPGVRDDNPNITDPRMTFEAPGKGVDTPYGLFSIFADNSNQERLIKIATSTNNGANIKERLAYLKAQYFETLKLMVSNKRAVKLGDSSLSELLTIINDWTNDVR